MFTPTSYHAVPLAAFRASAGKEVQYFMPSLPVTAMKLLKHIIN
jgi:hypothetical protein